LLLILVVQLVAALDAGNDCDGDGSSGDGDGSGLGLLLRRLGLPRAANGATLLLALPLLPLSVVASLACNLIQDPDELLQTQWRDIRSAVLRAHAGLCAPPPPRTEVSQLNGCRCCPGRSSAGDFVM